MDQTQIAKVYAKALLEISQENKSLDKLEDELSRISQSLSSDDEVWEFLNSPKISKSIKTKVIEKTLTKTYSDTILSLITILIKNDRISFLKEIHHQFFIGLDIIKGRIRIKVSSANELAESDLKDIDKAISDKFQGQCIIENSIDKSLLGGIIIKFNDKIIDGSMKNQLVKIKQSLLQTRIQGGALYEN